ncbi:MAG: hypothetical protein CL840_16470 [Crocinitomicaceae bacterium]|nr:hypothetical protein [Crocinitomicaceae bacterium]|tara:strand:- start:5613 stop:7142 length:1530 start_codon:yes stop_codon:yes gene_type:complete
MGLRTLFFDLWRSRGRNVRRKLLRDSLIAFSFVIAVITIMGVWQYRELRNNLLEETTNHALNEAIEKYTNLTNDIENTLQFLDAIANDSMLSPADMEPIIKATLKTNQKIYCLTIDKEGESMTGYRGESGYTFTKETRTVRLGEQPSQMNKNETWSSPYLSQRRNVPVISVSNEEYDRYSQVKLEVSLLDLHTFLKEISVSKHSEVLLFRPGNKTVFNPMIYSSNYKPKVALDESDIFQSYELSGSKTIVSAFDAMRKKGEKPSYPIIFQLDGQIHWMRARKIESRRDELFVGVIVPESDFIGVLKRKFGLFVLFLISALLLSAFLLFVVISKYGNQIKDLPQIHVDRKRAKVDLIKLIEKGESKHLEFKSTVRYHLKAERNDKVIEMAWLKGIAGFLNTEGGIMLLGITDDGDVHGIEMDNFDSEDKCRLHIKNLITRYIGVESLGYLNIQFVTVDSRQIVIIETEPASNPFYVQVNNEDQFYIRTGPASSKLSVSETVEYVKANFRN